jgi:hypothetical protein
MANCTLGSGAGTWTIASGETVEYSTSGTFLAYFKFGADRCEVEEFTANGVTGYGTKRHGTRDATITLAITTIQSSEAKCLTGMLDKMNDLVSSGTISYTVAGVTGIGRILGEQSSVDQPRSTGRGTYRADAVVILRKLRSS